MVPNESIQVGEARERSMRTNVRTSERGNSMFLKALFTGFAVATLALAQGGGGMGGDTGDMGGAGGGRGGGGGMGGDMGGGMGTTGMRAQKQSKADMMV